jgi:hypothetical protein
MTPSFLLRQSLTLSSSHPRTVREKLLANGVGGDGGGAVSVGSTVQGVDASTAVNFMLSLGTFRPKATIFEVDHVLVLLLFMLLLKRSSTLYMFMFSINHRSTLSVSFKGG